MASYRYVVADVFTDTPLEGNALAVFTDARGLTPEQMQRLALEVGLSETAFVLPPEGEGHVRLRIFTPRVELEFAGHPCLGTAFVLGAPMQLGTIVLETARGLVPVELEREGSGKLLFGRMAQPVPSIEPFARERELLDALGLERSELPVEEYDNGARHVFVACASPEEVAALAPEGEPFRRLGPVGVNCFARAGDRWKTRMFGLGFGIPEDPATG